MINKSGNKSRNDMGNDYDYSDDLENIHIRQRTFDTIN
jgi:hypothetical protein